jgi:hypothetical protein
MRIFSSRLGSFALGFSVSLGVALPAFASLYNTPGYQWGRTHCGRAPGTGGLRSAAECKDCCYLGAASTAYPADEYGNCQQFCDNAYWS